MKTCFPMDSSKSAVFEVILGKKEKGGFLSEVENDSVTGC